MSLAVQYIRFCWPVQLRQVHERSQPGLRFGVVWLSDYHEITLRHQLDLGSSHGLLLVCSWLLVGLRQTVLQHESKCASMHLLERG